ncbi:unnamed protein product [Gongylonema pulchrum]|uniref:Secreted protein n=1 Tax=Gongylonema pulchrum TaxID=637853 RepID=A0A183EJA4_9BILA|nr:unnamed protein product [Gongylonema pulchrum]
MILFHSLCHLLCFLDREGHRLAEGQIIAAYCSLSQRCLASTAVEDEWMAGRRTGVADRPRKSVVGFAPPSPSPVST